MFGKLDAGPHKRFVKRLIESRAYAKAFPGGFHLRAKADLRAPQFFKGKYRHLYSDISCLFCQPRHVSHISDLFAKDHPGSQFYDGNACHLTNIGDSTAGAGIYLDHKYFILIHDKLDVDQSHNMKASGQFLRIVHKDLLHFRFHANGRIYRDAVSRVDSRALDMFHNSWNQNILPVADGVHFHLFSHQVLVYQDGMLLHMAVNDRHKFPDIIIVDGDLHPLSAQHIRRAHKHRISQFICRRQSLFCSKNGLPRRSRNTALL